MSKNRKKNLNFMKKIKLIKIKKKKQSLTNSLDKTFDTKNIAEKIIV